MIVVLLMYVFVNYKKISTFLLLLISCYLLTLMRVNIFNYDVLKINFCVVYASSVTVTSFLVISGVYFKLLVWFCNYNENSYF